MQLFIAGYIIVVLANNFLFLFIGWEIVGLCVTYLTSYEYRNTSKAPLGLKVNIILRVGDITLLIFILTVYALSGTFNFTELSRDSSWIAQLSRSGFLLVSSLLLFGGIIAKAAQFPLHEWLPDMLVGTPSSSNALTECLAGPYLMARVLPVFHEAYVSGFDELSYFFLTVAWIGAITGLVTALTATSQRHPQRVMAYSISSIIGYMLTGLGLAGLSSNMAAGYLAGTTILTVDAFVSALLILATVIASYAVKSEDLYTMGKLDNKLAYHGMEVAVFAMINIPPFSGFWLSNWVQALALELSEKAYATGQMLLVHSGYGLFAFLILTGGVSAFYALRVMGLIFDTGHTRRKFRDIPMSMRISFAGLLAVTMILDLSVPVLMPLLNYYFLPVVHELVFQNVFDVVSYIVPSISTVMTIAALIVGGYVSRRLYITHTIDRERVVGKYPFLRRVHALFLNRLYIYSFYNKIAIVMIALSRKLYRNVEMEGIKTFKIRGINQFFDVAVRWLSSLSQRIYQSVELRFFEGINRKVAETATRLSEVVRRTQSGLLSYNMLIMLVGTVMIAVLLLVLGGY